MRISRGLVEAQCAEGQDGVGAGRHRKEGMGGELGGALQCSALHCSASCCPALPYLALRIIALHCIALHFIAPHRIASHCVLPLFSRTLLQAVWVPLGPHILGGRWPIVPLALLNSAISTLTSLIGALARYLPRHLPRH